MEETLNKILSELKQLNVNQQELMAAQKGLLGRIENLEKGQKNSGATSTRNINKVHQELMFGQQQVKNRMENVENKFSLGQNELKELILQTTAYMSGRLSVSERLKMEIDWLNEKERNELLIKINEKNRISKGHTWSDDWVEDQYNDY